MTPDRMLELIESSAADHGLRVPTSTRDPSGVVVHVSLIGMPEAWCVIAVSALMAELVAVPSAFADDIDRRMAKAAVMLRKTTGTAAQGNQ